MAPISFYISMLREWHRLKGLGGMALLEEVSLGEISDVQFRPIGSVSLLPVVPDLELSATMSAHVLPCSPS